MEIRRRGDEDKIAARLAEMKAKNEAILRRHAEVEADKRRAEEGLASVSTSQLSTSPVPNNDRRPIQSPYSSLPAKKRTSDRKPGVNSSPAASATASSKSVSPWLRLSDKDKPPPDPGYNFLADRMRDRSSEEEDEGSAAGGGGGGSGSGSGAGGGGRWNPGNVRNAPVTEREPSDKTTNQQNFGASLASRRKLPREFRRGEERQANGGLLPDGGDCQGLSKENLHSHRQQGNAGRLAAAPMQNIDQKQPQESIEKDRGSSSDEGCGSSSLEGLRPPHRRVLEARDGEGQLTIMVENTPAPSSLGEVEGLCPSVKAQEASGTEGWGDMVTSGTNCWQDMPPSWGADGHHIHQLQHLQPSHHPSTGPMINHWPPEMHVFPHDPMVAGVIPNQPSLAALDHQWGLPAPAAGNWVAEPAASMPEWRQGEASMGGEEVTCSIYTSAGPTAQSPPEMLWGMHHQTNTSTIRSPEQALNYSQDPYGQAATEISGLMMMPPPVAPACGSPDQPGMVPFNHPPPSMQQSGTQHRSGHPATSTLHSKQQQYSTRRFQHHWQPASETDLRKPSYYPHGQGQGGQGRQPPLQAVSKIPPRFQKQKAPPPPPSSAANLKLFTEKSRGYPRASSSVPPRSARRLTVLGDSDLGQSIGHQEDGELTDKLGLKLGIPLRMVVTDNLARLRETVGSVDPDLDRIVVLHCLGREAREISQKSGLSDLEKGSELDAVASELKVVINDLLERIPYLKVFVSLPPPRFDLDETTSGMGCPNTARKVMNVEVASQLGGNCNGGGCGDGSKTAAAAIASDPVSSIFLINNDSVLEWWQDEAKKMQLFKSDGVRLSAYGISVLLDHWVSSMKPVISSMNLVDGEDDWVPTSSASDMVLSEHGDCPKSLAKKLGKVSLSRATEGDDEEFKEKGNDEKMEKDLR